MLLDECVPARLRRHLPGFRSDHGSGIWVGEQAERRSGPWAEGEFDIFVTVDRNLVHQQNMARVKIPIIVLHARSNRLSDLLPLVPELLNVLAAIQVGQVVDVPRAETGATPAA